MTTQKTKRVLIRPKGKPSVSREAIRKAIRKVKEMAKS